MSVAPIARQGLVRLAVVMLVCAGLDGPARAVAPAVDLHDLTWHVHVDLIDPGAGRDLAWWQGVLDEAVASANRLIEGGQGPFDAPCCARLASSVALTTFGTPGDGLDVLDSETEQLQLASLFGSGSHAFLLDSITYCGGAAPATIGCAAKPGCTGNFNDDPQLWMAVTAEARDDGVLASVIAHERGHNACLSHVTDAECQLMQPAIYVPGNAGCLSGGECSVYRAGRTETASGQVCSCLDSGGGTAPDGSLCPDVAGGVCSGGLCGGLEGDAGVRLIAAGHDADAGGGPADDAIALSALAGDWSGLGLFAPTGEEVEGLAFAADAGVLYGVAPTAADDTLVVIDPATGAIQSTVATYANGGDAFVGLAYDPGSSAATDDDSLLVLERTAASGFPYGRVHRIEPGQPGTLQLVGRIDSSVGDDFGSLAYDSTQDRLFSITPFSFVCGELDCDDGTALWELDCDGSFCSPVLLAGDAFGYPNASLAYSATTGMLYLVGTEFGGVRTFYDVIDPSTGQSVETRSLDVFTPSGLAAVPEPASGLALGVGVLGVALLGGARRAGPALAPPTR